MLYRKFLSFIKILLMFICKCITENNPILLFVQVINEILKLKFQMHYFILFISCFIFSDAVRFYCYQNAWVWIVAL